MDWLSRDKVAKRTGYIEKKDTEDPTGEYVPWHYVLVCYAVCETVRRCLQLNGSLYVALYNFDRWFLFTYCHVFNCRSCVLSLNKCGEAKQLLEAGCP